MEAWPFDKSEAPEKVFNEEDLKHFEEYGYVILKQAISKEQCQKTVDAIWDFMQMDRKYVDLFIIRDYLTDGLK